MNTRLRVMMIVSVTLAAVALVAAGCGGSDEPEYCSNVSDLEQSVDDLKGTADLGTLQTDLEAVQSNANKVVSSAKEDFPSETNAVESSVSRLSTTVEELVATASAKPEQLRTIEPEISSVVTALQDLSSATSSACD